MEKIPVCTEHEESQKCHEHPEGREQSVPGDKTAGDLLWDTASSPLRVSCSVVISMVSFLGVFLECHHAPTRTNLHRGWGVLLSCLLQPSFQQRSKDIVQTHSYLRNDPKCELGDVG